MTDAVEVALIIGVTGAIPATIGAVLGFVNASAIRRQEAHLLKTAGEIAGTKNAMETLERNTNHKMDQLLAVTGESEFAKGKLQGNAEALGTDLPSIVQRQERDNR